MHIQVEERLSDSPFIERVWHGQTRESGEFTSIATSHWSLVIWQENGKSNIALRGPETIATLAPVPENSESFGVIFKLGVVMQHLPICQLIDNQIELPKSTSQSFWLQSSTWQLPNYDNIDTFVDRLMREDVLSYDPTINNILHGSQTDFSIRTAQRRFVNTTGMTHNTLYQIERARYTTLLLQSGVSIFDAIEKAGYYDQPHLTRSLKRFIGQTPTQLQDTTKPKPLSFLYKTSFFE